MDFYYCELIKQIFPDTSPRKNKLNALAVWGNYDFFHCSRKKIQELKELKELYEKRHPLQLDGFEKRPLFLCKEKNTEGKGIIGELERLCRKNSSPVPGAAIYALCLIQFDFTAVSSAAGWDNVYKKLNSCISRAMADTVEYQMFVDLGEADIVLLMKAKKLAEISAALMCLLKKCNKIENDEENIPFVKSNSLVILPVSHRCICASYDSEKKDTVWKSFNAAASEWVENTELLTRYIIDNRLANIYEGELFKNGDNPARGCLGDADAVFIRSCSSSDFENILPGNSSDASTRTIPMFPINLDAVKNLRKNSQNFCCDDIRNLKEDLDTLIQAVEKRAKEFEFVDTVTMTANLLSAQKTLINIQNYIYHLGCTGFSLEAFIHLMRILGELGETICELSEKLKTDKDKEKLQDNCLEMDRQLRVLIASIQQFLAIVSLSPSTFSEAQSHCMLSANAGLKLLWAYHTAARILSQTAGNDYPQEEKNGAVLILPQRDTVTECETLFHRNTIRHNIIIIRANFRILFSPREMLFNIAHEVGHYAGKRQRKERNYLLIRSAVKMALFDMFNGIMEQPLQAPMLKTDEDYFKDRPGLERLLEEKELNLAKRSAEFRQKRCELVQITEDFGNQVADLIYEKICRDKGIEAELLDGVILKACKDAKDAFIQIARDDSGRISCRMKELFESGIRLICFSLDELEKHQLPLTWWDRQSYFANMRVEMERMLSGCMADETLFARYFSSRAGEDLKGLYSDVFCDVFAISRLQVKEKKEYLHYVLGSNEDKRKNNTIPTAIRVNAVLFTCFSGASAGALAEELKDLKDHMNLAKAYEGLLSADVCSYAASVYSEYCTESAANERNILNKFYQSPEEYFLPLWYEEFCDYRKKEKKNGQGSLRTDI